MKRPPLSTVHCKRHLRPDVELGNLFYREVRYCSGHLDYCRNCSVHTCLGRNVQFRSEVASDKSRKEYGTPALMGLQSGEYTNKGTVKETYNGFNEQAEGETGKRTQDETSEKIPDQDLMED